MVLNEFRTPGEYVVDTLRIVVKRYGVYLVQEILNLETGERRERIRQEDGSWRETDYAKKADLVGVAAGDVGVANETTAGLMSSDHVRALDDLRATIESTIAALKAHASKPNAFENSKPEDFAPADHAHGEYAHKEGVRSALEQYLPRSEFNPATVVEHLNGVLEKIDATRFGSANKLVTKDDFTAEAVREMVGPVNAAALQGKTPEDFAPVEHVHDQYVPRESYRAKPKTHHAYNGGGVDGGAFTPDIENGPVQRYHNSGAHTFCAPSRPGDYDISVFITNGPNAGVVEFYGFDNELAYIPSEKAVWRVDVTKIGAITHATVVKIKGA